MLVRDRNWRIVTAISGIALSTAVVSGDALAGEYDNQLMSIHETQQTAARTVCHIDSELPESAAYSRTVIQDKLGVAKWHHPIFVMNVTCSPRLSQARLDPGIRVDEIGTYGGDNFYDCVLMPAGGLTPAEIQAYCLERGRDA
jgi:hypothetical protein